jgi:hypothetical protein
MQFVQLHEPGPFTYLSTGSNTIAGLQIHNVSVDEVYNMSAIHIRFTPWRHQHQRTNVTSVRLSADMSMIANGRSCNKKKTGNSTYRHLLISRSSRVLPTGCVWLSYVHEPRPWRPSYSQSCLWSWRNVNAVLRFGSLREPTTRHCGGHDTQ